MHDGMPKKSRGARRRRKTTSDPARTYMPTSPPKRDYPPCALSGEPIDSILAAIIDPDSGGPSNIDAVIQKLTRRDTPDENEAWCYIGEGRFGLVRTTQVRGKKRVEIIRTVQYEDPKAKPEWRTELSPGISRDYTPKPIALDTLYTDEETRSFPRFDVHGVSYMTRAN